MLNQTAIYEIGKKKQIQNKKQTEIFKMYSNFKRKSNHLVDIFQQFNIKNITAIETNKRNEEEEKKAIQGRFINFTKRKMKITNFNKQKKAK